MTNATKAERGMDIAQDYDLTLLQSPDIDDETGFIKKLEFAVGYIYEPAAGSYGGAVSPWFDLATEAYAWCADNEEFLKGMFGEEPEVPGFIPAAHIPSSAYPPLPERTPAPEPARQAQCYCCKRIVEVNEINRRQFIITPRPETEMDSMYCGCRGWN